jgi:hypothetical protein
MSFASLFAGAAVWLLVAVLLLLDLAGFRGERAASRLPACGALLLDSALLVTMRGRRCQGVCLA